MTKPLSLPVKTYQSASVLTIGAIAGRLSAASLIDEGATPSCFAAKFLALSALTGEACAAEAASSRNAVSANIFFITVKAVL